MITRTRSSHDAIEYCRLMSTTEQLCLAHQQTPKSVFIDADDAVRYGDSTGQIERHQRLIPISSCQLINYVPSFALISIDQPVPRGFLLRVLSDAC